MKKTITWLLAGVGVTAAAYISAAVWWRLWMYEGWPAPPRYLHRFIWSDGEGSYNLTYAEMFGVCLAVAGGLWTAVRLIKHGQNHAVVSASHRTAPRR